MVFHILPLTVNQNYILTYSIQPESNQSDEFMVSVIIISILLLLFSKSNEEWRDAKDPDFVSNYEVRSNFFI